MRTSACIESFRNAKCWKWVTGGAEIPMSDKDLIDISFHELNQTASYQSRLTIFKLQDKWGLGVANKTKLLRIICDKTPANCETTVQN